MALFLLTIWIQEPISIVNTTQNLCKQQERNKGRAGFVIFSFLADNAPVHTSEFSTEVMKGCGLTALSYRPYSPSDF